MTIQSERLSISPERQSFAETNYSVTISTLQLQAADRVSLTVQQYNPNNPPELTVLMLPGIGVPQRAFRHLARWLAMRGARCISVDYRGMRQSATRRGIATATLTAWARKDAAAALSYCRSLGPEPVVLIGHSFGGQAVGLTKELRQVSAAVFIGSQFGQARHWDGVARWRLALYWHVFLPLVCTLFRVLPRWTGLAGPLPQGVAREWARWGRSQNWYLSQEPESADLLARFSAPILAYGVSDDLIAPPRAVTAFLDQFAATAPIRRNVDPRQIGLGKIGHVGLLRPSQEIEVIWQEILDFLRREAVQGETSDCVELSNQRARA